MPARGEWPEAKFGGSKKRGEEIGRRSWRVKTCGPGFWLKKCINGKLGGRGMGGWMEGFRGRGRRAGQPGWGKKGIKSKLRPPYNMKPMGN